METRYASIQELIPAIQELIDVGQSVKITITGNSMLPLLRHEKDQVALSSFDGNISKGDLVLIRRFNGAYVLHRIISINFETKSFCIVGDAQSDLEGPLSYDQIVAVVSAIYRGNKRIGVQNLFYKGFVWFWFKLIRYRTRILSILRKLRIIP